MRITLAQLRKLTMPYSVSEELDLSDALDGYEDIISSGVAKVDYIFRERGIDTYQVDFKVKIDLKVEDSVTLDEVNFPIECEAVELFSNDELVEDAFPIDGISIDTKEAVLTNVLMNKPMTISNSEFDDEIEDDDENSSDSTINPAFASLKDLL